MISTIRILSLLVLLSIAPFARAGGYMIYQIDVNSNSSCASGFSTRWFSEGETCLVVRHSKMSASLYGGATLKVGGNFKTKHGTMYLVVEKINPKGEVGAYKATGFDAVLLAAGPYVGGAGAALSGQAPPTYPAPDNPGTGQIQQASTSGLPPGNKYITPTTRSCVRTEYVNASLYLINGCNVAVYTTFTSDSGNTWGGAYLSQGQRSEATAMGMGYNPRTDGTIYTFTCPQPDTPVMPNGNAGMPNNYRGEYLCHVP